MARIGYVLLYVCLGIVAVFQVFPIIWLFFFSLKDNSEIFTGSPFALPSEFRWENYIKVWEGGIGGYFWNSIWITVVAIILDRKSTRLNSSHVAISYAVFCLN